MIPMRQKSAWRLGFLAVLMAIPVIALGQRLVFNTGDPRLARAVTVLTMLIVGWLLARKTREHE